MRKFILSILSLTVVVKGYSENPRFKEVGTPIPANANLSIVWDAGTNEWAKTFWIYHVSPNQFSPQIISNLENVCGFTANNRIASDTNGLSYQNTNDTRKLVVHYAAGHIHYEVAPRHYDENHLTIGVPEKSSVPKLTSNILDKIDIKPRDITGYFGTNKIEVSESGATYFVGTNEVQNTEFRFSYFRRSVNGLPVVGSDGGRIYFGEHGEITKILIDWKKIFPFKLCRTLTRDEVVASIREGKARMGLVSSDIGELNWADIKNVKVEKAWPSYYIGTSPASSQWMYPFMTLWVSADTAHGVTGFEIDCPIITED